MSDVSIINAILGIGYLFQLVVAFGMLYQYRLATSKQYIAMMTKKGLMAELMLVIGVISATVSVQNLVEVGATWDKILFIWRIVFNIWSVSIWVRWFGFNRFVLRTFPKNE